jgi:hypothetical protein
LFDISQSFVWYALENKVIYIKAWWPIIVRGFSDWYIWAALSPLVFQHARTFPLGHHRWRWHVAVHFIVSVGSSLLVVALMVPVFAFTQRHLGENPKTLQVLFWDLMFAKFTFYLLIYWGLLDAASSALSFQHAARDLGPYAQRRRARRPHDRPAVRTLEADARERRHR